MLYSKEQVDRILHSSFISSKTFLFNNQSFINVFWTGSLLTRYAAKFVSLSVLVRILSLAVHIC